MFRGSFVLICKILLSLMDSDAFRMADIQISIYIPQGGPNGQELSLAAAKLKPSYIDQVLIGFHSLFSN
jgi:hypothetical protein